MMSLVHTPIEGEGYGSFPRQGGGIYGGSLHLDFDGVADHRVHELIRAALVAEELQEVVAVNQRGQGFRRRVGVETPEPLHVGVLDADPHLEQLSGPYGFPQKGVTDVGNEIAEPVNVEDFAHNPAFVDLRLMD